MNFTLNNHLTYSIGGREFGRSLTPYEKYVVKVGRVDPQHYTRSNYLKQEFRTTIPLGGNI